MDGKPSDVRARIVGWMFAGLTRGFVAGVSFIAFNVVANGLVGHGYVFPLRLIGAILLGEGALPPAPVFSTGAVVAVALFINSILSSIFGAIFGAAVSAAGVLSPQLLVLVRNRLALLGAAMVFGFLLWGVNFYVLAVFFDSFPWFIQSNPLTQAIAHIFFYGGVLGLLLAVRVRK